MRDQVLMEELDGAANVDQLDRPALDQWLSDKRKDQKQNKHKRQKLMAESNRISKIIKMYDNYGSDKTALV